MRREPGFALITVVLLMIGLAVLATGLIFAAAQHATVSATLIDLTRARHGAEAAVAIALEGWVSATRSLDPLGATVEILPDTELDPGLRIAASVQRIGAETFLVSGAATATRSALPPIRRTAARVVRSLDVDELGGALDAAIVTRQAFIGAAASVTGSDSSTSAHITAAALCSRWPGQGSALRAPPDSVHVASEHAVSGMPAVVPDEEPLRLLDAFGAPDLAALRARAPLIGAASVTPAPVERGLACDTGAPGNWGSAAGSCADHYVLRHAPRDLRVAGGYGQGILIVDGDLVLEHGFTFRGVVIAAGTVTLRDATIHGTILAGAVEMVAGAAGLDRCAIADALVSIAVTRAAYPPARSWLPTFD